VTLYKNVSAKRFTNDGAVFNVKGREIILTGFDAVVISEKQSSIRDAENLEKKAGTHLIYCISEAEELADPYDISLIIFGSSPTKLEKNQMF
jgi:hypothetical protein